MLQHGLYKPQSSPKHKEFILNGQIKLFLATFCAFKLHEAN